MARSSSRNMQSNAVQVCQYLASSITLGSEAGVALLQGIAAVLRSDDLDLLVPAIAAVIRLPEGSSSDNSQIFLAGVMPLLVQGLTLTDSYTQAPIAKALRQLAVNSQQGRDEVIAAGGLPLLLSVLQLYRHGVAEPYRFQWAATCLEALSAGPQHDRDAILAAGCMSVLVAVVRVEFEGDFITRRAAATVLGRLMKGSQQAKDAIIHENAVHMLVHRWALPWVPSHAEATEVLACLASVPEQAHSALLAAEATLTGLLNSDNTELRAPVSQALAALAWAVIGHHARLA